MLKIYSVSEPSKLLHIVFRGAEGVGREQLIDPNEYLQIASLNLKKGEEFLAHKHLWKILPSNNNIAQESWVVLKGKIEVTFYDTSGELLQSEILTSGDISITLYGGHSYKILEDSRVFEFKSGPYLGKHLDMELL
jgi:hypothetical protein